MQENNSENLSENYKMELSIKHVFTSFNAEREIVEQKGKWQLVEAEKIDS
jgi:hypothetical protein